MSRGFDACPKSGLIRVRFFGSKITIHKDLLLPFQAFAALALYTSYGRDLFNTPGAVQSYNCRSQRGNSTPSEHARGTAIDIRPPQNPYRATDGSPKPQMVTDMAKFGLRDGIAFVNAAKRAGFRWGGDWSIDLRITGRVLALNGKPNTFVNRISDPMHLEFAHDRAWIAKHKRELEWLRDTAGGRRQTRRSA